MEYKSREVSHSNLGRLVLEKISKSLQQKATCSIQDRIKGNQLVMNVQPRKVVHEN
jgi:translation initiation factor IF-3